MEATTNSASDYRSRITGHLLSDAEEVPAGVTEWAAWAWTVLANACDVPERIDEHAAPSPAQLATLAGLCHVYDLFEHIVAGHTSRLTPEPQLSITAGSHTTGAAGAADDERHGSGSSHRPDALDLLLHEVIETRTEQLRARLCAILGVAELYASLRAVHTGDAMPDVPAAKVGTQPDDLDDFYAVCQCAWPVGEQSVDEERVPMWLEGSLHLD